jgi:flagellar FliL protein
LQSLCQVEKAGTNNHLVESCGARARQETALACAHPAKSSCPAARRNHPLTIANITFPQRVGLPFVRTPARTDQRGGDMAAKAKPAATDDAADADADEAEGQSGKPARKFPLKLIIIAAGAVIVLGGGGTAAYMMLAGHNGAKPVAAVAKPVVFLDVPEVLVNLASAGSERTQYLKVKIVLEFADATLTPQIQTTMPRVMDAFQTYLRELRPTDLDGSAGLYRLKEELTRRVNVAIAPSRINAVLFKEIVVQ